MHLDDTLLRFSLLLLFVPALFAGAAGLAITFVGLRRRRAMEAWPRVRARVLETAVRESAYRGAFGSKELAWDLEVEYEYRAAGKTLTGRTTLEVDVPRRERTIARDVVDEAVDAARARLADGLEVHVHPQDPSMTMLPLEPAGRVRLRLALFAGTVAASLAALGFVVSS